MLRRLLPKTNAHVILTHPSPSPAEPTETPGLRLVQVAAPTSPSLAPLEDFTANLGFGAGWSTEAIKDGAIAFVAFDSITNQVLAMAWLTTRPFEVAEIQLELRLPRQGAYFFGDFVAPTARGRGLQKTLVQARLAYCAARGLAPVTLIHPANLPSMKSYTPCGFKPLATLVQRRWLGMNWAKIAPERSGTGPNVSVTRRTLQVANG